MDVSKFYVIAVVSNPIRYKSRIELYKKFEAHMAQSNANLITVECAFGDRSFEVTKQNHVNHVQVRSFHELWNKESLINIGINYLSQIHPAWDKVAWIDADIEFTRKDWVSECLNQLEHYMFLQMFQNAIDLGPTGEALSTHYSFMSQYLNGKPYNYKGSNKYSNQWHPGYCWAARREAITAVGTLLDTAILGAGDNHMAHSFINKLDGTLAKGLHPNYIKKLETWQEQCERYIRRDVGYMPGTIIHHWHGSKKSRGYHSRWKILVDNQFDPNIDIQRDEYGLYQLVDHGTERSIRLRDQIRAYFRSRNEDSIDLA